MFGSLQQYSPLEKNESDVDLDLDSTSTLLPANSIIRSDNSGHSVLWYRQGQQGSTRVIVQVIVLLTVSLGFFSLGWMLHTPSLMVSSSWGDLNNIVRYKSQKFEPHFVGPPSEYEGQPSPELDAKWYKLAALRNFAVDQSTLAKANKTKANVEYPHTSTYQAGLEAFHQLHCLNYIRMYTERSYYKDVDHDMLGETEEDSKVHKDHCVENLRQRLICMPDLQIYTYDWVSNGDLPFADLRTNHQCIDCSKFYNWAETHVVHSPALHRPAGAEMLNEEDKWGS